MAPFALIRWQTLVATLSRPTLSVKSWNRWIQNWRRWVWRPRGWRFLISASVTSATRRNRSKASRKSSNHVTIICCEKVSAPFGTHSFHLTSFFMISNHPLFRSVLDPFALAIPAPPLPPASSSHHHYQQMCGNHCSIHPFTQSQTMPQPASSHSYYNPTAYNQPCNLHNYVPPPNNFYQLPQNHLPHSKSLDQYDGKIPPNSNGINHHHRLSLDHNYKMNQHLAQQQQQQVAVPPFDCIDSVAFNHPYNQPNVRSPLPYNLSSNLGHHLAQDQQYCPADANNMQHYSVPRMYGNEYYHQIPTPVSDYHQFSDTSSPAMPESELISFGDPKKPPEPKLRSSLKKTTQSSSDADLEQELNELRALKRGKATSEVKARDGIGNYQSWNYVFENLEKEPHSKNRVGHDDKVAAELQLENLKLTSNGHGPPKGNPKSNGVPHRMSETLRPSSNHTASVQTKTRTKSVSNGAEASNHEHKRTSSVMETSSRSNNMQKYKPPVQPAVVVPPGEWSCRFCTFLNADNVKICEMCAKSKDFFLDADKGSTASATCVWDSDHAGKF